jgi:predicted solute-binding protein
MKLGTQPLPPVTSVATALSSHPAPRASRCETREYTTPGTRTTGGELRQIEAAAIALDERLETAFFSYPFRAGWVAAAGVTLAAGLTADTARGVAVALLDSLAALTLLRTHVIVRDAAVASRRGSMLTLSTHTRPDEVDNVTVGIGGVSPAGRGLATAVLRPFYGINAGAWVEDAATVDASTAVVSEGAAALIADEDEEHYQEDLGRAWFLLTTTPFVSHACVAPRALLASDPGLVAAGVERLRAAYASGQERARELRRDLSRQHGVDRELLAEVLADQSHVLDDEELSGLAELARRAGLGVSLADLRAAAVRVS